MKRIVIVGGGSFIGNLINYIEGMNEYDIVGYRDIHDNGSFFGYKYLGSDNILPPPTITILFIIIILRYLES